MKILIVDDAGFIRDMLVRIFLEAGLDVIGEAATGLQAIALTEELNPDIIFMDLVLPDMNGLEATAEIIKKHPQKKIIACTSLYEAWVEAKAMELGCCYFIKKPFYKDEILKAIDFASKNERLASYG